MKISSTKTKLDKFERELERENTRSMFVSLFWSIIAHRKKTEGLTFSGVADALGINKSAISRWFNKTPNWRLDTISDLANVLDVELTIEARDLKTGAIYTPAGTKYPYAPEPVSIPDARFIEHSFDTDIFVKESDYLKGHEHIKKVTAETDPQPARAA